MKPLLTSLKEVWRRLSPLDVACFVTVVLGLLVATFGISGKIFNFLLYLAVIAGLCLLFRFIGWSRSRLLWSLRNRLIVAYLFIAFVPLLLLLTLAVLAAQILYSQLAAYLLYQDLQRRVEMIGDS